MRGKLFWVITLLFTPAVVGLLGQVIWGTTLSHRVLALGFALMGLEQGKMAIADLSQVAQVQEQQSDPRLDHFHRVILSTIAVELLGFYGASLWLGWGAGTVLLSQIWFNGLAGIQLQPEADPSILPCDLRQRLPVLLADCLGLLLLGLWLANIAPLAMALGLLAMVVVYGSIKYGFGQPA